MPSRQAGPDRPHPPPIACRRRTTMPRSASTAAGSPAWPAGVQESFDLTAADGGRAESPLPAGACAGTASAGPRSGASDRSPRTAGATCRSSQICSGGASRRRARPAHGWPMPPTCPKGHLTGDTQWHALPLNASQPPMKLPPVCRANAGQPATQRGTGRPSAHALKKFPIFRNHFLKSLDNWTILNCQYRGNSLVIRSSRNTTIDPAELKYELLSTKNRLYLSRTQKFKSGAVASAKRNVPMPRTNSE